MIIYIQQDMGSGVKRTVASWKLPTIDESIAVTFVGLATADTSKVARYELIIVPDQTPTKDHL